MLAANQPAAKPRKARCERGEKDRCQRVLRDAVSLMYSRKRFALGCNLKIDSQLPALAVRCAVATRPFNKLFLNVAFLMFACGFIAVDGIPKSIACMRRCSKPVHKMRRCPIQRWHTSAPPSANATTALAATSGSGASASSGSSQAPPLTTTTFASACTDTSPLEISTDSSTTS